MKFKRTKINQLTKNSTFAAPDKKEKQSYVLFDKRFLYQSPYKNASQIVTFSRYYWI